jgi:prepilin-type N-terminal cleavage/methylation domain-containing protein
MGNAQDDEIKADTEASNVKWAEYQNQAHPIPCRPALKSGFTLIEMSIVLTVIGLVVGGVLTGQELIKAAGRRATLSQLERYNTATRTFQNKYGYLPGDIPDAQASAFGFYYSTISAGTMVIPNGDGILTAEIASKWPQCFGGEVAMFFLHLSQANLIDGLYGTSSSGATLNGSTATGGSGDSLLSVDATGSAINAIIPPAKLGNNNSFVAVSDNTTNYFIISGITTLQGSGNCGIFSTNNLTPLDAYAIDNKIDDGTPATGRVFALDTVTTYIYTAGATGVTTPSANNCVHSGAYYTNDSVHANLMNCSLRFNFQ